jgi:hypothetical protein
LVPGRVVSASEVDDSYRDDSYRYARDELSNPVERGPRSEAALTIIGSDPARVATGHRCR